ncbi:glycyl-tRNA synthetase beta chain [Terribacillus halophilus]|uniref:Glycine--tRNA ligase beta subunit n=1 Tax=Terribacillus halophilus TaxID=361279 RepID=A0A1G6STG0_9BACI|nr:glycine--tRNA ligase subunit beta [Terribacillus halophilus]SDD19566.1 glycyl-tRNA synthetase beta chain [Terribacillus halophilus]
MQNKDVLFEIGLEEMPARFLPGTIEQLETKTAAWLHELGLSFEKVVVQGTPRRVAVTIQSLSDKQPDIEEEVKGPAVRIAKDDAGQWSKAAQGFTRGQGASVEDIFTKDVDGTEYIFVKKFVKGQPAADLLPSFKEVLLSLHFPKNMRWGSGSLRYARPIRWIVALYGEAIIPLEIAGIESSNLTYGHRFLGSTAAIDNPGAYVSVLEEQFVIVDQKKRQQMIIDGIRQLETANGWQIPIDEELLEEVLYLVEYPTVFHGNFADSFLDLPEEVLITSMKEHQRYFPVTDASGKLLAHFIGVRNGNSEHLENVARGNEKVLRARLQDAEFFYAEDKAQPIEKAMEKLSKMIYQVELGTLQDKVDRVTKIAKMISETAGVDQETASRAERAASIAKFDLVTNMVNEFTELQGVMGEKYARHFGEDERVAQAIREQYMPLSSHGALPESVEGTIVSIADKLDTIIGSMVIGNVPTGSQDPYGLRRQAVGIIQMLAKTDWQITVEEIVERTAALFEKNALPTVEKDVYTEDVRSFFHQRAAQLLKEEGISYDVVEAVLAIQIGNYPYTLAKAKTLQALRNDENFKTVQEALGRVINLAKKGTDQGVDESLFENEQEKQLYRMLEQNKTAYLDAASKRQAKEALDTLAAFADSIHAFFDHTMVMAEDEKLKTNRLSLLNQLAALILSYADVTKVQWKQVQ